MFIPLDDPPRIAAVGGSGVVMSRDLRHFLQTPTTRSSSVVPSQGGRAVQTIEDVLELVTLAREHIACGLVHDARWMLELVEGDLLDLARPADQRQRPPPDGP